VVVADDDDGGGVMNWWLWGNLFVTILISSGLAFSLGKSRGFYEAMDLRAGETYDEISGGMIITRCSSCHAELGREEE
jgi:hypothetical protein